MCKEMHKEIIEELIISNEINNYIHLYDLGKKILLINKIYKKRKKYII